jgi:hypothetical protein
MRGFGRVIDPSNKNKGSSPLTPQGPRPLTQVLVRPLRGQTNEGLKLPRSWTTETKNVRPKSQEML